MNGHTYSENKIKNDIENEVRTWLSLPSLLQDKSFNLQIPLSIHPPIVRSAPMGRASPEAEAKSLKGEVDENFFQG